MPSTCILLFICCAHIWQIYEFTICVRNEMIYYHSPLCCTFQFVADGYQYCLLYSYYDNDRHKNNMTCEFTY